MKNQETFLLYVIFYKTLLDAVKDVPKINGLRPSAVELVDNNIVRHIKIKVSLQTGCLLFVEFDDNIKQNRKYIQDIISGKIIITESNINKITELWNFRNSASCIQPKKHNQE